MLPVYEFMLCKQIVVKYNYQAFATSATIHQVTEQDSYADWKCCL